MSKATLAEAIEALKEAKQQPDVIRNEIAILEAENMKDRTAIKARTSLIRTLNRLAGITKSNGTKVNPGAPEEISNLANKVIAHLKERGPKLASDISRGINVAIGPLTASLNRGNGRHWEKQPNGYYALLHSNKG